MPTKRPAIKKRIVRRTISSKKTTIKLHPKKLRQQQQKQQPSDEIIDGINVGIFRTSPGKKGVFIAANHALAQMFEASSKEKLQKYSVIDVYANPDDRDKFREQILKTGSVKNMIFRFKTLKGNFFWGALTAHKKINSKGEPFFEGFLEDVTPQKLAYEQLQKEKILNESIVATAISGILVVDKDGKVILFNHRFTEIFDIPVEILNTQDGNKMSQYVLKNLKDPKKFIAGIKELSLHPDLKSSDEVAFKDGRLLDRYSSPLADAAGNYIGRVWFFRDITERSKAEATISQAKLLNESIITTAINGILVVDETGKAILFNQNFAKMFGIPPEILETQDGNKMSQYVLKNLKDPRKFIAGVKELYLHKELKSRDEVEFKDGRFLDRYSSPLIDANNIYRGRVWFFRDITEQKKSQAIILQAKVLNESIINTSIDGILVVDKQGKALAFNQRFSEIFGIPDEIQKSQDGNKMSQYVLQNLEDPRKFIAGVKELFLHPDLKSSDEVAFKDGRLLDRYSSPLADAAGNYIGRVWFFRDITERSKAEAAISQAKLLNESIINTSIDGILVVDQQGKALVFNQRFSEMFSIPPGILSSQDGNKMSQYVLTQIKYPKKFIAGVKELYLHPNMQSSDEVEFKDGRFLDRYSSPLIDAYGNAYGRVWFFRDITERKRSAEARFQNIFENSPGSLGEADFSELKIHLNKLEESGITNTELFLKTHRGEVSNCIKLIKFSDINRSFLKLYEVSNKNEFVAAFFAHLEKEKMEMAIKLICAVANNQKSFSSDLEDVTQQNNKIEVIFQYTISPGYEDFSKVLLAMVDVTKLKQIEKQLAYSAVHDPLTNLPNRILFNETLNNSIYRSIRTNIKMALLYLDIDNFKKINDSQGHDVGDLVLMEMGKRLKESLRKDDFVARLGGDEFAIVLNGLVSFSQAGTIAKKIKSVIDGIYKITSAELNVTTSIGIAICPDNSEIPAELIKYADIALYSVKNCGRDNYRYHLAWANFFPKMDLERELSLALQQQQFFVVYQPQYDVKSNIMIGMEAYVRWQHADLGLIFPENFIPLIEQSNLVVEIGNWIIESCCTQYVEWLKTYSNLPQITINLCARQLLDNGFLKNLDKVLSKTGMPPKKLEFDLTETTITNNLLQMTEVIKQIKERGVKINLDNINSNTLLLKQTQTLCIEKIKIEQNLIGNILGDTNAATILQQILATAKKYSLQVVVIGIENKAQLSYLLDNECFIMQGYYLCKPLTSPEMTKFLQSGKFF